MGTSVVTVPRPLVYKTLGTKERMERNYFLNTRKEGHRGGSVG